MYEKISQTVKELAEHCLKHNIKVACAESCTGGWVSHAIVSEAGSSDWFDWGIVSYSNEAKQSLLGVELESLETLGAVSKEVAQDMALGMLQPSKADITVAITGVAGPSGGTDEKPVGLVWFAFASRKGGTKTQSHIFEGDQTQRREQAVLVAPQGLID